MVQFAATDRARRSDGGTFDFTTVAGAEKALEAAISAGDGAAIHELLKLRRLLIAKRDRLSLTPACRRDCGAIDALLASENAPKRKPDLAGMARSLAALRAVLASGGNRKPPAPKSMTYADFDEQLYGAW